VEVRVVPKDRVFIHGKAGVIEAPDGSKTCFLGSINETKSAFAQNYEILWEDPSEEGVSWVEELSRPEAISSIWVFQRHGIRAIVMSIHEEVLRHGVDSNLVREQAPFKHLDRAGSGSCS